MKVILDASVVISAFLIKNSTSSKALYKALDEHTILISSPVLDEIRRTLPSNKFDAYVNLSTRIAFVMKLEKEAQMISVEHTVSVCRDPKDNKYLELALSGKANFLITGDKDLLILNPFENIPIITPRDFIENF